MKEGIWEETTKIKEHLGSSMEPNIVEASQNIYIHKCNLHEVCH